MDDYWRFSAKRVGDVIFLCESERYLLFPLPIEKQRVTYRGLSFGEYVTVTGKDVASTTDKSVTNFEEFVAVTQSTLGPKSKSTKPLKLLYNGEIDAIYKNKLVELKMTNYRREDEDNKEWFLQSYFMGITDIFVCYDERGIVKKVKPLLVKNLCEASEVDVCMNLLYKVLNKVKSMLEHDGDVCVVEHLEYSRQVSICLVSSRDIFSPKFKEQFEVQ